jgi:putative flippase GtrA
MGLLAFLVSVLRLHYLAAATLSFIAGGFVLYALSVWTVFGHRRLTNHAIELSAFLAFGVVGLFVNAGVVWLAVEQIQLHFMVGKLVAAVCTFGVNFMLRRHFLFSPAAGPQALASREAS